MEKWGINGVEDKIKWGRKKKGKAHRGCLCRRSETVFFFLSGIGRDIRKGQLKENGEGRRKIGFEFMTRKKI